jgi:hypothetical protein
MMDALVTDNEGAGVSPDLQAGAGAAGPAQMPEPVQAVKARNQVNAERQAVADERVRSIVDGLKVAALQPNSNALPYTRELASHLQESVGNGVAPLPNLQRYLERFS